MISPGMLRIPELSLSLSSSAMRLDRVYEQTILLHDRFEPRQVGLAQGGEG